LEAAEQELRSSLVADVGSWGKAVGWSRLLRPWCSGGCLVLQKPRWAPIWV